IISSLYSYFVSSILLSLFAILLFFFSLTASIISTLSLHDALPIFIISIKILIFCDWFTACLTQNCTLWVDMPTFAFNMVYTHLYHSLLWLNFFKMIFQFIKRQGSFYFIHYNFIFFYEKCARYWFNIIQSSHFALFVMWNRKSQVVFVNEIINNEFTCI